MKAFYHTIKIGRLLRVMMLAIMGIVASAASAETIDLGELELDKEYSIPGDFNNYIGHVTAPKSGVLTYSNGNVSFNAYSDADLKNSIEGSWAGYLNGARTYTINVTEGNVYYFYYDFAMNAGTFKVSMSNALELLSATVEAGSKLSAGGRGAIEYTFNQSIALDGVTISSGSNSAKLSLADETYRVNGATLIVEYGEILTNWYNQGLVKEGDEVKVSATGLCSYLDTTVKYNSTGNFEVSYVAAGKPVTLVSATTGDGKYTLTNTQYAPCKFLSYFTSDNADGKYVFTFSDPIDPTQGSFEINYGSQEASDWYVETLTPVFSNDNKTITLDVTGKLRDYKQMSILGYNYGEIIVAMRYLTAADGQLVYTGVSGSEGSFSFPFYYKVVNSTAAAEFTPSDKLAETIEIYVSNYSEISYDGVKFSWTKDREVNSIVVPKSELSIEEDNFGGAAIVVTVPAEVKSLSNVTVTLNNLTFSDGQDHSATFTNVYNEATSSVATDLNYSYTPNTTASVSSCSELTITFPDYAKVKYGNGTAVMSGRSTIGTVTLEAAKEGATGSEMIQPISGATNNDHYTVTFPEGYFELEDNLYSPEFAVTFIVYAEAVKEATSVSTTPADGEVVDACDEIVVTFNDYTAVGCSWENKATISKDGGEAQNLPDAQWGDNDNEMKQPLGGLAAEDGTYTVTFPARFFALGEEGNDFSDEIVVTFTVGEPKAATLNVVSNPESGSTVESCNEINLVFPDYGVIGLGSGKATISRRGDMEYGTKELGDATYGVELNEAVQSLGGLAEEEGMYIVTFPAGYFDLLIDEDDENPVSSPEFYITFVVEKAKEVVFSVVSNPESGSTVESCDEINLTFPDYGVIGLGSGKATISRRGDMEYGTKELGDAAYGVELNEAVQSLGGLAEEEGMYIVTFPAGYFDLLIDEDDENPVSSPEFYITFVVEKAKEVVFSVVSNPESGSTVESCNEIDLVFPDYGVIGLGGGKATITRRGDMEYGTKELGDAAYGVEYNEAIQSLNGLAEEEGMYIVTFPAGYFYLFIDEDDENPVSSPEFYISFVVEKAASTELNITSTPANGAIVESCDAIDLIFDDYEEVGPSWWGKATISKDGGEAQELGDLEVGTAYNELIQPLNGTAAEDGTYVVTFPDGYITGDENHNYDNLPGFTITFTVSNTTGVNTISVNGEEIEYYNLNGVKVANPVKGIYIVKRGTTATKQTLK